MIPLDLVDTVNFHSCTGTYEVSPSPRNLWMAHEHKRPSVKGTTVLPLPRALVYWNITFAIPSLGVFDSARV